MNVPVSYKIKGMVYRRGSDPAVDAMVIRLPAPDRLVPLTAVALGGVLNAGSGVLKLDDEGNIVFDGEVEPGMAPHVKNKRYLSLVLHQVGPNEFQVRQAKMEFKAGDDEQPPWEIVH